MVAELPSDLLRRVVVFGDPAPHGHPWHAHVLMYTSFACIWPHPLSNFWRHVWMSSCGALTSIVDSVLCSLVELACGSMPFVAPLYRSSCVAACCACLQHVIHHLWQRHLGCVYYLHASAPISLRSDTCVPLLPCFLSSSRTLLC